MSDVAATYAFRPGKGVTPGEAARAISREGTIGTWTPLTTRTEYVARLEGSVEEVIPSQGGYTARIHYPSEAFDTGNIAQYLSIIAGNLFGLSRLETVRLIDIEFPDELVPFRGPKFGISGIRRLIGTHDRPHIGTIIKPGIGLTARDTAARAYQAAIGGVDLIMDDAVLTNQAFCPLEDRVPEVMARLDEARSETGQQSLYAVNISSRADRICSTAHTAIRHGANMIMIDVLAVGFSALQALGEDPGIRVPIHVHRTMHAAMTRNPEHGISMLPIARFVRMLGGDQVHAGSMSGRMWSSAHEVGQVYASLTTPAYGHKRVFPVASGGLHPGKVGKEISLLGQDVVLQAGGGIHGHPDGTAAGARAMRQAVDAYMGRIPVEKYAEDHYELERALKAWGSD